MTSPPADLDLGTELAPFMGQLAPGAMPVSLAGLERSAGDRYLGWAAARPEVASVLRDCAAREHRIAGLVENLFPLDDADRQGMQPHLDGAIGRYRELFDPHSLDDQLRLQEGAERQGAAAWEALAATETGDAASVLLECATLERASADALASILEAP